MKLAAQFVAAVIVVAGLTLGAITLLNAVAACWMAS